MKHHILKILAYIAAFIGFAFIFLPPFNDWSWKTDSNLFNDYGSFAGAFFSLAAFFLLYATLRAQTKQYERDKIAVLFLELLKIHQRNTEVITNSEFQTHDPVGEGNKSLKSGFEYLAETIRAEYVNEGDKKVPYVKGRARISDAWDKDAPLETCKAALFLIMANYLVKNDNLGLYFRHLFSLVKFIVRQNDKLLSYEDKRDYLEVVRSTMSKSAQICLYYYWVSGHGRDWENDKNRFLTDYRMIRDVNPMALAPKFTFAKIAPFEELLNGKIYLKKKGEEDDYLLESEGNPQWDSLYRPLYLEHYK